MHNHIPHQLLEEQGFDSPIPTVMAADAIFAGQLLGLCISDKMLPGLQSSTTFGNGLAAVFFENSYIHIITAVQN
jgi:hypothetical protein